jgi:hypothetical protein
MFSPDFVSSISLNFRRLRGICDAHRSLPGGDVVNMSAHDIQVSSRRVWARLDVFGLVSSGNS